MNSLKILTVTLLGSVYVSNAFKPSDLVRISDPNHFWNGSIAQVERDVVKVGQEIPKGNKITFFFNKKQYVVRAGAKQMRLAKPEELWVKLPDREISPGVCVELRDLPKGRRAKEIQNGMTGVVISKSNKMSIRYSETVWNLKVGGKMYHAFERCLVALKVGQVQRIHKRGYAIRFPGVKTCEFILPSKKFNRDGKCPFDSIDVSSNQLNFEGKYGLKKDQVEAELTQYVSNFQKRGSTFSGKDFRAYLRVQSKWYLSDEGYQSAVNSFLKKQSE